MNSLWLDTNYNYSFPSLNKSITAEICIIGAGIFGLTCAYYLSRLGFSVVVLEKDNIAGKTTGHTTGKITSQHGLFYNYLWNNYSEKFAADYLKANEEAIKNIADIIEEEKISCDFSYQNNYVYTTDASQISALKKEFSAVDKLGFPCKWVTKTGLPFKVEGAICFPKQAKFHPLKYVNGLVDSISKNNGKIFTNTTCSDVNINSDGTCTTSTLLGTEVKSNFVIMASHYPFINFPGLYFTKMYQSNSYVIAIDTRKKLFSGMHINAYPPIFSFRTAKYQGRDILLVSGLGHKTGQTSTYPDTYLTLEAEVKKFYPDAKVLFRWSTKDCISLDKIPYIGSYSSSMPNVFVGTGFKKWGMTLSNVAANILVDKIQGKNNSYEYLFNPSRLKPIKNYDEMKNMLVQSTTSLLIDKLKSPKLSFDKIKNNSGGIIEVNNKKVGVYKNPDGKVYAVKPVCTHLGCLLSWNDIDKTWDCPCHGSRFNYDGKNIYDPAFRSLERYF